METPDLPTKLCKRCNALLPIDNFTFHNKDKKQRRQSYCRACNALNVADWRKANPEKRKAQQDRQRHRLRKRCGISFEEYLVMLEQQGGGCAGCNAPPTNQRLAVDHDHSTGKIRGLLCTACNTGIGLLRESPEIMTRLIQYLAIAEKPVQGPIKVIPLKLTN